MNIVFDPKALSECDREKIHQIGTVQSFGALVAVSARWKVTHVSDNFGSLLDLGDNPKIGSEIADCLSAEAIETLRKGANRLSADKRLERIFGITLSEGGDLFDCAIHASGAGLILEFEPHGTSYDDLLNQVGPLIAKLSGINDPDDLCMRAAEAVRALTGYARVMVYRFRRDLSGEVIAESARDDLEPFLGLRYPKDDIPLPARELFLRNTVRVIADVEAEASPIQPANAAAQLDLTNSVLRSSSLIHLQYLRNMGVGASLTIAIVRHGKLWGLVSCHHDAPKLPPFSLRTVVEMFSQVFSLMLDRLLIDASEKLRTLGREMHENLLQRLSGDTTLVNDIPLLEEVLAKTIKHDGMSVWMGGDYRATGSAPTDDEFIALLPDLTALTTEEVLATPRLSDRLPAAHDFSDRIAGALVLPISRMPRDFLILWREPLAQTVRWGGKPAKSYAPGATRLEPRSSFTAWSETVEGLSDDWSDDELVIARSLRITLIEVVLRMTDEIARERKRAQEQQELLIAELNHRVRNILNLISSLVQQSQNAATSVADFSKIIGGRISALASAHDNITRENWAPAPLSSLIESEFAAYAAGNEDNCRLIGEDVLVKPEAYTVLALVLHELVTNSVKYGALSNQGGHIDIELSSSRVGDLKIAWRERGGPPVKPPKRRSFGSIIIERSIPFELKGESVLRFVLGGVEADFVIPAKFIGRASQTEGEKAWSGKRGGRQDGRAGQAAKVDPANPVPGRVLVVEDNMIIALGTEENLRQLGVEHIDVQSTVAGTLEAIAKNPPDFAILDYNLGTESSLTVTEELNARNISFVLATGYSETSDQIREMGAKGVIKKPYGLEEIEQALIDLAKG